MLKQNHKSLDYDYDYDSTRTIDLISFQKPSQSSTLMTW